MDEELFCPFCKRDGALVQDEGDGYWRVLCTCTALGPLRASEEEAIAAWNAAHPAHPDVGELVEQRDAIITRLNSFIQCGCCDEEWPQLRHDTVALIRAQRDALAAYGERVRRLEEALNEIEDDATVPDRVRRKARTVLKGES
jgi:hypothetical protein